MSEAIEEQLTSLTEQMGYVREKVKQMDARTKLLEERSSGDVSAKVRESFTDKPTIFEVGEEKLQMYYLSMHKIDLMGDYLEQILSVLEEEGAVTNWIDFLKGMLKNRKKVFGSLVTMFQIAFEKADKPDLNNLSTDPDLIMCLDPAKVFETILENAIPFGRMFTKLNQLKL